MGKPELWNEILEACEIISRATTENTDDTATAQRVGTAFTRAKRHSQRSIWRKVYIVHTHRTTQSVSHIWVMVTVLLRLIHKTTQGFTNARASTHAPFSWTASLMSWYHLCINSNDREEIQTFKSSSHWGKKRGLPDVKSWTNTIESITAHHV